MVSAIPDQLCKTAQVLPARPPVCTLRPPPRLPGLLTAATRRPATAFVQKGSGAWDLMFAARTSLSHFLRGPQPFPVRHEPTATFWPSNGCSALRLTKSIRRFAHLCRLAVFSVFVTAPTITSYSSQNVYSQHCTGTVRLVAALGLLTSNLYHPSHCRYDASGSQLAQIL